MRYTHADKANALCRLQHLNVTLVYSIIRSTSRTTHTKSVDFVVVFDGRIVPISNYVAVIIDGVRNAKGQLVLTDSEGDDPIEHAMGTLATYCAPTLKDLKHRSL